MFKRLITKASADLIRKAPPQIKSHLRRVCDEILINPHYGKPLNDELRGFYSWRHTHYRVIYRIDEKQKIVIIEYVGARRDVYEMFAELKRKSKGRAS